MSHFKNWKQLNQNLVCSYGENLNFCFGLIRFLDSEKIRASLKNNNKHTCNLNFKWLKTCISEKYPQLIIEWDHTATDLECV